MTRTLLSRVSARFAHRGPGEVVVLDNRDSFTYNLVHRFAELDVTTTVVRSDAIDLATLIAWQPRALVLSPGPGHPRDAGICIEAIEHFSGQIPILGICLGHQAIGVAFGGHVSANGAPCHGKATPVEHDGQGLFAGLTSPLEAGRYHSLVVEEPLPDALEVHARAAGFVMALAHRTHPTYGIQFHPESVLTPAGLSLLEAFFRRIE